MDRITEIKQQFGEKALAIAQGYVDLLKESCEAIDAAGGTEVDMFELLGIFQGAFQNVYASFMQEEAG